MTTIIENGKRYEIEDGRVVTASVVEPEVAELPIEPKARVSKGGKLGTVVAVTDSIYGDNAVVKFDDGSIDEVDPTQLVGVLDKEAAAELFDSMEDEYLSYQDMPTETEEDIQSKAAKARELNLRAKALATNGQNALKDQIAYDHIVTATAVDIMDLEDARAYTESAKEYVQAQPRFHQEVVGGFGMTRGGDASWLADAADTFDAPSTEDAELAQRAAATVAPFSKEQLSNEEFMKQVAGYAIEYVPADSIDRFKEVLKEAIKQRLAEPEENVHTASTLTERDLDGNDFLMDDVPVEALYGV